MYTYSIELEPIAKVVIAIVLIAIIGVIVYKRRKRRSWLLHL